MFERYAVFFTPTGPLAAFGAAWLGWDSAAGRAVEHPGLEGLDVEAITATPRKYGLHATLKAPFRLSDGVEPREMERAAADFAKTHSAFEIGNLALRQDLGFVALRPAIQPAHLEEFAAATVRAFDPFRAPLTETDIARRRKAPLTARQDLQMLEWGYPFIFDDFQFHMTLSGTVMPEQGADIIVALSPLLSPVVPSSFEIDAITLMGEDRDGMFHQIHRYALTG